MSIRSLPGRVVLALLAVAAPASASFSSTTLLYQTPTADVLPAGALAISGSLTFPLVNTPKNVNDPEVDAGFRFSPLKRLNFAVTAYTFSDYALDLTCQLLGGGPGRLGLAVGICDIGLTGYISPVGRDTADAWPDWKYNQYLPRYDRQTERFSAFVVASFPMTEFARLHLGLGRGRFVGYDDRSKFLNIDNFFDKYHQWAFGLFGGAEFFITPKVALVAEASGRDFNTGVKFNHGAFTATAAWTKVEGLVFEEGDARFGRLELGLTWQFDNLSGLSSLPGVVSLRRPRPEPMEPVPPPEPVIVPVAPVPTPAPTPIVEELKLEPIWFEWDKWAITPAAESALHRNAAKLAAHPEVRVVVSGYASEEGTLEHNLPLSARRASAAYEYLKSLGVPGGQMRFRAMGESPGRPLPPNRVVYFEIQAEK